MSQIDDDDDNDDTDDQLVEILLQLNKIVSPAVTKKSLPPVISVVDVSIFMYCSLILDDSRNIWISYAQIS